MANKPTGLFREVHSFLIRNPRRGLPGDRDLLERFCLHRDEVAFEELVRRHGPLVLGVCRRTLGNTADAEDAFQATFLLLAQRAVSVRKQESVASWLFGVSRRVAGKARIAAACRRRHENRVAASEVLEARDDLSWKEAIAILDEELGYLPQHYRAPVLLCYLEGKSREEAARQLDWTPGMVRGRLARGRELLRRRLSRRGLSMGAGLFASVLSQPGASAATTLLRKETVQAVLGYEGVGTTGALSAHVIDLAKEALPVLSKLKATLGIAFFLAVTMITAGASLLARQPISHQHDKSEQLPPSSLPTKHNDAQIRVDRFGDPLPPQAIARLGTTRFRHSGWVNGVAYAPDGKRLASHGDDGTIRIWETITGKELYKWVDRTQTVLLAFSPTGKSLASVGFEAGLAINTIIRIWDVASGKELRQIRIGGGVHSIAFSPDGKILATGGSDKVLRLWDSGTGEELRRLEGHKGAILSVAFSHDGKHLASGSMGDNAVCLWEVATGKEVRRFEDQKDSFPVVLFSPDDKNLIIGDDKVIHWWDIATGQAVKQFTGHKGLLIKIALSPDGKTMVSGSYQEPQGICIWDVNTAKMVRKIGNDHFSCYGLALSPDGKTIAVASDGANVVRLWEVGTGKEILSGDGHQQPVTSVRMSADGKTAVSLARDGTMRQWDAATGEELRRFDAGNFGHGLLTALSPDGKVAAVGTWKSSSMAAVRLLEASTGKVLCSLKKQDGPCTPVFSPDGRILATADDKAVRLSAVPSGTELREMTGITACPSCLCFSADGTLLAVSDGAQGSQRFLRVYDVITGKELQKIVDTPGLATGLAFTPDKRTLAAWHYSDGKSLLLFWKISSGKMRSRLTEEEGDPGSLVFSPDGRMLASYGPHNTIRLWEVSTACERHRLKGHGGRVVALSFSADGKRLLSGSEDTTILNWNLIRLPQGQAENGTHLSTKQLEAFWVDLASDDAALAYQAEGKLMTAPKDAPKFLQSRLHIAEDPDVKAVPALVGDLDAEDFAVREKAALELEKLGTAAKPGLRKALKGRLSAEAQRQVEKLLQVIPEFSPERLQALRALEVLERLENQEARQILDKLAGGAPEAWLTKEAKMISSRLAAKQKEVP